MLGLLKKTLSWQWGASGKHPVAKDFISIGAKGGDIENLYRLIENLYSGMGEKPLLGRSWRFFLKGEKKDMLSLGIIRDSNDALGRHFPLIVAGSGQVKGWGDNWQATFTCLAKAFLQIEFLCTKRINGLEELRQGLSTLNEPALTCSGIKKNLAAGFKSGVGDGFILLESVEEDELLDEVEMELLSLSGSLPNIPAAVFLGGTQHNTWLSVFKDKLNIHNIERLWAVQ
jgi:hypothetical protein